MRPADDLEAWGLLHHLIGRGCEDLSGPDSDVRSPALRDAAWPCRRLEAKLPEACGLDLDLSGSTPHSIILPRLGDPMVPRGLEPRTLRLLAVRSNQRSYETDHLLMASCKRNVQNCKLKTQKQKERQRTERGPGTTQTNINKKPTAP